MPQRSIAIFLMLVLLPAPCLAAQLPCRDGAGAITRPAVPTPDAAKAIYRTTVGRMGGSLNRLPIIVAQDTGDHWTMAQTSGIPFYMAQPGPYAGARLGTGLSMDIDKCTGAISNVHLQR